MRERRGHRLNATSSSLSQVQRAVRISLLLKPTWLSCCARLPALVTAATSSVCRHAGRWWHMALASQAVAAACWLGQHIPLWYITHSAKFEGLLTDIQLGMSSDASSFTVTDYCLHTVVGIVLSFRIHRNITPLTRPSRCVVDHAVVVTHAAVIPWSLCLSRRDSRIVIPSSIIRSLSHWHNHTVVGIRQVNHPDQHCL